MSKRSRGSRPADPTTTTQNRTTAPGKPAPARGPAPAGRGRAAPPASPSPLVRYRGAILGLVVVAILAVAGIFIFAGSAQPAYACATVLVPAAPASPAPGATPRLGQLTTDLGRAHVETGTRVTYEYCPPTSGPHYNDARFGPIPARFYGKDDHTNPEGWIHNLEHGMTTVLYRCPEGCDDAAQTALGALQGQLPVSPLCGFPASESVVVTRFDDLPTPYAVVAWGRADFLDSLDVATITTFRDQSADRGPEPRCQNSVPGASPSAAPSTAPAPSAAPSVSPTTPAPSAVPSVSPTP